MPTTDDELQKNTVGELKPHNAPITLVEYDSSWPELFEQESNRIHSVLGSKALQIEHVGSTSIPGLCAKPIIDILLVVKDSADVISSGGADQDPVCIRYLYQREARAEGSGKLLHPSPVDSESTLC